MLGEGLIATNQVDIHPCLQAPKLVSFARSRGLALTAYRPLATGEVRGDAVLARIGQAHGVTASAIALAFLMAEGHIVIPASANVENLKANLRSRDVRLTEAELGAIRALDRGHRSIDPAKSPRWDD